ncbi:MAG: hypothetical protein V1706_12655 [Pseudomonadota bacterium]
MDEYGKLLVPLNSALQRKFVALQVLPGMGFGDPEKWWCTNGKRPRPHEGVDICCYVDDSQQHCLLGESIQVPFFSDGKVIAITKDFHASSVFVRERAGEIGHSVAVYSHILPVVQCGCKVMKGGPAGMVAPSTGPVPPHLHLSLLKIFPGFPREHLNWDFLNRCDGSIFVNPFLENK